MKVDYILPRYRYPMRKLNRELRQMGREERRKWHSFALHELAKMEVEAHLQEKVR